MIPEQRYQITAFFDEHRQSLADLLYRMECAAILQGSKDGLTGAELENILSSCRIALVSVLHGIELDILRQSEAVVNAQKIINR